jgi:hypothetical protein
LTEAETLYFDFWTQFVEFARSNGTRLSLRKPRPQHWYSIAVGRSGFEINLTGNTSQKRVACELYIFQSKSAFAQLNSDKERIESEVGAKLDWQPLPKKRASRIKQVYEADLMNRTSWKLILEWMKDRAEVFQRVFTPRVRGLVLEEGEETETDGEAMQLS